MSDKNLAYLEELEEARERVGAHYVASVYKDIDLFNAYNIHHKHLKKGSPYTFYFLIAEAMIRKGGYETLDIVSVDTFVKDNMSEKGWTTYKTYGGYDTIETVMGSVEEENIESYYSDVLKYSALIDLHNKGYNLEQNWKEVKKLSYKELSDYINEQFGEIFVNADLGHDVVMDIKHDIRKMVEDADKGALRGIPYASKLLTAYTNGMRRGEITVLAGKTGEGKTFLATNLIVPQMVKAKQKLMIICNEEDIKKWQREILTYLINDIIVKEHDDLKGEAFNKGRMFRGQFTQMEWRLLDLGIEKMHELFDDGLISFINLTTFSMDKAINIVRQHSSKYNTNYYILDTLKLDNDIGSDKPGDNSWLALQQASVKMYNTIKDNNRNAHILFTYQLNKQNVSRLTLESLGMSKNIVDVASTVILTRNMTNEEKASEGLKVMRGDNAVALDEASEYMILFLVKNRAGSSNKEIVLYTDKAHNIIRDVGLTVVPVGAMR